MLVCGKHIGKLDWQGGAFSYGSRIAIGQILQEEPSEYKAIKKIYREVYGFSAMWLLPKKRYRVFQLIIEALQGWIDKEQRLLHYEPSEEEKRAGIKKFSDAVGDMATIRALAKEYSQDPDTILKWSYSKVFGILYCNLEEHKYNERYKKVIDERNRRYSKARIR